MSCGMWWTRVDRASRGAAAPAGGLISTRCAHTVVVHALTLFIHTRDPSSLQTLPQTIIYGPGRWAQRPECKLPRVASEGVLIRRTVGRLRQLFVLRRAHGLLHLDQQLFDPARSVPLQPIRQLVKEQGARGCYEREVEFRLEFDTGWHGRVVGPAQQHERDDAVRHGRGRRAWLGRE